MKMYRYRSGRLQRRLLVLLLWLTTCVPTAAMAAEESPSWRLSLAYVGEWVGHPGFAIGAEYPLRVNERESYALFGAFSGGAYFHDQSHNALFFDLTMGNRFTTPVGYFGEVLLGAGYLHTWPDGTVYTGVDATGALIEKEHRGDPHLKVNLSLGLLGWDFGKRTALPLRSVVRLALFGEYPYNDFMLPHVALEVACTYPLGGRR